MVELPGMRVLTLSEASDLTGLTEKALRRCIERGSLQSVLRDGARRIPMAELDRAGLVPDAELRALRAENQRLRGEVIVHRVLVESTERARLAEIQARERLEAEVVAAKARERVARERLEALASAGWWERRKLLRELRTS